MTIPLSENAGSVGFILGCVVLFIGSAMAAGGGLGGGGIFVPVLILIVGFDAKVAVPLSQAMIFGGSLVNLYIVRKNYILIIFMVLISILMF